MLSLSEVGNKRESLIGKSDVIRLAAIGIEGQDTEDKLPGISWSGSQKQEAKQEEK